MNDNGEKRPADAGRPDEGESDRHDAHDDSLRDPASAGPEPARGAGDPNPDPEPGGDETDAGHRGGNDQDNDQDEAAKLREAMLRLKAEMDNREKRLEREMIKTRKFAVERLVGDLIPVLDSMDQALASAEGAGTEGLQLTRKQALQVLAGHGLEVLDPLGERFDPTWHEAIATQPSESDADDTVLQVLQKGYRLNERLVRPARVIVAKGP